MITRRAWMATAAAAATFRSSAAPTTESWGFCLNTSTIRGQKLSLPDEVDLAARAGYQGIEPWVNEVDRFVQTGGSLEDLKKQIADRGLLVADLIGFPEWIVEDDAKRRKGLDEAKRTMELVRKLGGERIAAPPIGAHQANAAVLDLRKIADRYFALAELGKSMGVVPLVEVWGFSPNIKKLSDAVFVALESGHPSAAVLPDVYHLHRGGSPMSGLNRLAGSAIGIFHVNDYPSTIAPEKLVDANRVYPGDGAAPWPELLRSLWKSGYRGMLSLELFNPEYWKQDAFAVASTGLEKLRNLVRIALAG